MNELIELLENIGKICQFGLSNTVDKELQDTLTEAVEYMNKALYKTEYTELQNCHAIGSKTELETYLNETIDMLPVWSETIRNRMGKGDLERRFSEIYDRYKYVKKEKILEEAIQKYKSRDDLTRKKFEFNIPQLIFLNGRICEKENDYSLVKNYIEMMKEHIEEFKWLYEILSDNRSRYLLLEIVNYWTDFDLDHLLSLAENHFKDYYDLDIIPEMRDEVFVDCGAYYGDSVIDFVDTYGPCYKKVYAYEMVDESYQAMCEIIGGHENIILRKAGVGEKRETMFIDETSAGMGARITDHGKVAVEVVPIDEDIKETVTTIKMDIEGAEIAALKGARRHIVEDAPKLLISAYHKPADLFDIPRLICEMREDYNLYLRFNGESVWPADYIIIAVPGSK